MAYVGKTNLEDVASSIQSLKWHEMDQLGFYLSTVEAPENADASFWSRVMHDWSTEKMDEYEARLRKEKEKEQALNGTANG